MRQRSIRRQSLWIPYAFLAPFLVIFLGFRIWPMIYGILLAFFKFQGLYDRTFVGLANFSRLFTDPMFPKALTNTAVYTIGTLVLLIPIPLMLAAFLNSKGLIGAKVYEACMFMPALTSLVVTGAVFRLLLTTEGGVVNQILNSVGLPSLKWLNSASLAIPSLLIIALWRWTGINIIYFLSGLTTVPEEYYEAAIIDGANSFQRFWYITVPLLKPIAVFVLIISTIGGFQLFSEPFIVFGGGGPGNAAMTLALYLYNQAFTSFDLGYAAALGVVMAIIIMIASITQFVALGFFRDIQ